MYTFFLERQYAPQRKDKKKNEKRQLPGMQDK